MLNNFYGILCLLAITKLCEGHGHVTLPASTRHGGALELGNNCENQAVNGLGVPSRMLFCCSLFFVIKFDQLLSSILTVFLVLKQRRNSWTNHSAERDAVIAAERDRTAL